MIETETDKLGIAPTMSAAASRSGYSLPILKRAKDEGCPAFDPSGRVDVDAVVVWVENNVHVLQLDPVSLLEYQAKKANKDKAVFILKREMGQYIPVEIVRESLQGNQVRLKSLLQKALCQELPQKGAMQDAPTLRELGEQLLDGVCDGMQKGVEEWMHE